MKKNVAKVLCIVSWIILQGMMVKGQEPELTWRLANPQLTSGDSLVFDVELKCNQTGTYHHTLWIYFDYNTDAFGQNINTNGRITYEMLELLQGNVYGYPKYGIMATADNQPYRYFMMTEAYFQAPPSPVFYNEVDTAFKGFMRFRIAIGDMAQCSGIEFVPSDCGIQLMNGGWHTAGAYSMNSHYDNHLLYFCFTDVGVVSGTVADSFSGNGVPYAVVVFDPGEETVITGPDGGYQITLDSGQYSGKASALHYFSDSINAIQVDSGQMTLCDFVLLPTEVTLSGEVRDASTGLGIGGLTIHIEPGTCSVMTAADGSFSVTVPYAPLYTLTINAGGYCPFLMTTTGQTFLEILLQMATPPAGIEVVVNDCEYISIYIEPPVLGNEPEFSEQSGFVLEGYNIYCNGNLVAQVTGNTYTFSEPFPPGLYHFCVTAVYTECESDPVCADAITEDCYPPENLVANTVWPDSVELCWDAPQAGDHWLTWCDTATAGGNGIGMQGGGGFSAASKWEPSELAPYTGMYLTHVRFFWYGSAPSSDFVVAVWDGPDGTNMISSQPVINGIMNDWNEVALSNPVPITEGMTLWFGYTLLHQIGSTPAGTDLGPAVPGKGDLIKMPWGSWYSMFQQHGYDFNWALMGFVSDYSSETEIYSGTRPLISGSEPSFRSEGVTEGKAFKYYRMYCDPAAGYFSLCDSTESLCLICPMTCPGMHRFYVTAVYDAGESEPSNIVAIDNPPTGVQGNNAESLRVFPVPGDEYIHITSHEAIGKMSLLFPDGRIAGEYEGRGAKSVTLFLQSYNPGVYLLVILTEQTRAIRKVIIR
ncbi:MAG: carboxypeptidase regulatory-like domain-containing protein [Bacteroidales bacterium]|nr:carboxypeptidase regulatory-like domain-containing protein [Bacteroidales bacterium]